ncbi:MAG: glucosaminidase domain-containing protein, partial [Gammaproteobacteria bacterium]|nr:glucosaminidase domain-containing protein [Gammaproteobacteria bacterium]
LLKQSFIDKLLPYIEQENTRLKRLRKQTLHIVQQLDANIRISDKTKSWLKEIAKKFRVKGNPVESKQARYELLTKVDIIPSSLTLAQAATESAWGKSRFATEANNLFGIWTYNKSKGLKPKNRDSEKKHLVRIFDHYGESVAYYMHTLNSHPAYKKLRKIRQQLRNKQLKINGLEMANGLEKYSAKGNDYIQLIRKLIRQNEWAQLDGINRSA